MISNHTSTVAAISTPPGKGGIAVIRISGTDTAEILKKVEKNKSREYVKNEKGNMVHT